MGIERTLRNLINRLLGAVNVFLFSFMVVIGTYQILVRYLFNRPSTVSEELLTYAFTWMSLLAAAYVFGERGHMRMSFFADRFSEKVRVRLELAIEILIFTFAAVILVYGGIQITALTMSQKTASLGIPMGYLYGIVPVCGILIMVYSLLNLAGMLGGDDGEGREA